jgi:hypothetical protein
MAFVMVSPQQALVREFTSRNGDTRTNRHYFGKASPHEIGPEAFVVPVRNRTLGAHFHDVDQFQILLGEAGSYYQRHEVPAVMVHYADAYSTYGPLVGTDPPLRFFSLRADPTDFAGFMPEDRDKLRHRGKRQAHFEVPERSGAAEGGQELLMHDESDGLTVVLLEGVAGATVSLPAPGDGKGQFVYVARGVVEWQGETFGPESVGWQPAQDAERELTCVEDCQVVVMRFPSAPTNPRFDTDT